MDLAIRNPPRSGREGKPHGFTLIELLIVMAIVGVLAGISVAGLSRIGEGTAIDGAWRIARSSLVQAKKSAQEKGTAGRVIFMPGDPPEIILVRSRDAASIQFTESAGGKLLIGRNNTATMKGVNIVEGGTVRTCAQFSGDGRVICDQVSAFDPTRGFSISFDVWPDPEGQGGQLASFGTTFSLELHTDGSLSAALDMASPGPALSLKTAAGVLANGAWARVELSYDGFEAILRAHNVAEARAKAPNPMQVPGLLLLAEPEQDQRLSLGGKGLRAFLDEVVYRTLEEDEVVRLERSVSLGLKSPLEIHFGNDGQLDSRFHDGPVVISLLREDEKREIHVDLSGVFR